MAKEAVYSAITNDCIKRTAAQQAVVECKLKGLPEEKIVKVLSVSCGSQIAGYEAVKGEASFNGRVAFKALYLSETNKIVCLDYTADFNDKLQSEFITAGSKLMFNSTVLDTDTVSVNYDEIALAAVIEVSADALVKEEIKYLSDGGDLTARVEESTFNLTTATADYSFDVAEEYEAKDQIAAILYADSQAYVKSAQCSHDSFVVSGECVTSIIYATSHDHADITFMNIVTPFREELSADGATAEDVLRATVAVKKTKVICDVAEGETTKNFKVLLSLNCKGVSSRTQKASVVTDAYSLTHDTNLVSESYLLDSFVKTQLFTQRIEGNAALDDAPPVDQILAAAGSRINIANALAFDGKVVLEGVISTNIIYLSRDSETKNSIQVELPYSVSLDCPEILQSHTLNADATIFELSVRNRMINEIEITAEIKFNVNIFVSEVGYVVKEVVVGGEKLQPVGTISIYCAKQGQTLWDLSKALLCSVDDLTRFNPDIAEVMEGGERIVVYRQGVFQS